MISPPHRYAISTKESIANRFNNEDNDRVTIAIYAKRSAEGRYTMMYPYPIPANEFAVVGNNLILRFSTRPECL